MSEEQLEIISRSVSDTIALGEKLGKELRGGEIIALSGNLGTGKTHFIKGLALGLEVPNHETVTSPTFTLINEYKGRLMLYHMDAYRLDDSRQLEALGFDEFCCGSEVVVVEWADKVISLLDGYHPIFICLEHRGRNERAITLKNLDPALKEKLCPPG